MLVLGIVTNPESTSLTGCSICKYALCIDPCFRLYHTEKDYTSEKIKIVTHSVNSVKPVQKVVQHVQKDDQHVQRGNPIQVE